MGTRVGDTKHKPEIELVWEEPPEPTRDRSPLPKIEPFIKELRRNPGMWARLATYRAMPSAANLRSKLAAVHRDIDFTTRRLSDECCAVYGRMPADDE